MTIRTNRRDFLHVGFAGGIGLTLADFLRLRARAEIHNTPSKEGKAKSVIFIFLPGGASPSGDVRSQAVRTGRVPRADVLDRHERRWHRAQ